MRDKIFGDVYGMLSVRARKGETIWQALKRQGAEVRRKRGEAFKKAIRKRDVREHHACLLVRNDGISRRV